MLKKLFLSLALAGVVVLGVGCNRKVVVGAPVIDNTALTALDATASIANGLKLVDDSVTALHSAGSISDAQFATIQLKVKTVAQENDAATRAIQAGDAAGSDSWTGALSAVVTGAQALTPQALGITDPKSVATYDQAFAVLQAATAVVAGVVTAGIAGGN